MIIETKFTITIPIYYDHCKVILRINVSNVYRVLFFIIITIISINIMDFHLHIKINMKSNKYIIILGRFLVY